ncbi:MAG: glycosyltransferase [Rickettsiales bacterium]|nr:glycosyltransferase [Rickettsiales bacterium]
MRVFNVMFSESLGGIEQSFVDYTEALVHQGVKVTAIITPEAQVATKLGHVHAVVERFSNRGLWDFFAVRRLAKLINSERQPDVILVHGNRALSFMRRAAKGKVPVVAVCHNYNFRRALKADAAIAITRHMRQAIIGEGMPEGKVFHLPNMVKIPSPLPQHRKSRRASPIIGAMGRFVKKKGFSYLLDAFAILKQRGVPCSLLIGGTGAEEAALRKQAQTLGIEGQVDFSGWVNDKRPFFEKTDIFCLPSIHEPFGIILLEALLHGLPVVSTESEGPSEIAENEQHALLVPTANAEALANALQRMVEDKSLAERLAKNGQERIVERYRMETVEQELCEIIRTVMKSYKKRMIMVA